jgi:hypothetical protein
VQPAKPHLPSITVHVKRKEIGMEESMGFWNPTKERRELVKFWLNCAQALSIPIAVIGIAATYWWNADSRARELRKPFDEKQLELYGEAGRVAARLAFTDNDRVNSDETWIRFWELYWGALPFVESPEIRSQMFAFCKSRVSSDLAYLCGQGPAGKETDKVMLNNAIAIARAAKCEIRDRWSAQTPEDCPSNPAAGAKLPGSSQK